MNSKKIIFILFLLVSSFSVCAVEYRLAMSKDDHLCNYVKNTYENAPRKYSDIDYEKVDMFSNIGWKKIPVKKSDFESEYAVFDIDNDSIDDLVVRIYLSLGGIPVQSIVIHSVDEIDIDNGYYRELYKMANRKISMRYLMYHLDEFPERPEKYPNEYYVMRSVSANPFYFEREIYLSFQDSLSRNDKKWMLVAKYNGGVIDGRFKKELKIKLDEKCYFEIIN